MSNENEKFTAVQAVVDRVESYQESAPEGTVDAELRKGLAEAGVSLEDSEISTLVLAIESDQGPVDVAELLG